MKIKFKKTLILGLAALSSIAIVVPTLLTSCSNKPKYIVSWSSQIYDNIQPYIPDQDYEYNHTTQEQALKLWMDNLSDKQKTLDVLSLPLTAVDSYLGFVYPFVPADSLSPLQIEVYKSQFKWAKDIKVKNFSDDSFFTSTFITWSFDLKINFNPAFPLSVLNVLPYFKDEEFELPDWNIGSLTLKVNNMPWTFGFWENNGLFDEETKERLGLADFGNLNIANSFDWQWDDLDDIFLSNGGPPVGSSVTDSVGTSDVSMGIHIIAPFDKTLDFTIPPSWFYYGICIPSWRYSCNWASYYLSNLSIEPPIRPM